MQTFIAIGRDGKVHRLSAKKSSFIFDPFNRLRRIGIRISWDWQLPLLLRIALIFFCFSFVLPNYANNSVSTLVWNFTRFVSFYSLKLDKITSVSSVVNALRDPFIGKKQINFTVPCPELIRIQRIQFFLIIPKTVAKLLTLADAWMV